MIKLFFWKELFLIGKIFGNANVILFIFFIYFSYPYFNGLKCKIKEKNENL